MGEVCKAFALPSIIGDDGLEGDLVSVEEKLTEILHSHRISNKE